MNTNDALELTSPFFNIFPVPLTNAGAACVSQNETTDGFKSTDRTVTVDGSTDLLRIISDSELALDIKTVISSITGNVSGS
jgi:hypothetical protein